tara:strand:- start:195 stop:425 length:231 start_codon:yes stop_codon:yes gene_type:complete
MIGSEEIYSLFLTLKLFIMPEQDVIMWPFEVPKHIDVRSPEHQKFLINKYNEGKKREFRVKTMQELIAALEKEAKN